MLRFGAQKVTLRTTAYEIDEEVRSLNEARNKR